jgi:hypothetical protein
MNRLAWPTVTSAGVTDRRFSCARSRSQRTIDAFRARPRPEVEPEAVRPSVFDVVRDTLQPTSVTVWRA